MKKIKFDRRPEAQYNNRHSPEPIVPGIYSPSLLVWLFLRVANRPLRCKRGLIFPPRYMFAARPRIHTLPPVSSRVKRIWRTLINAATGLLWHIRIQLAILHLHLFGHPESAQPGTPFYHNTRRKRTAPISCEGKSSTLCDGMSVTRLTHSNSYADSNMKGRSNHE